jgi:hypothetical protein
MNLKRTRRRSAYARLMAGYAQLDRTIGTEQRWAWLMAAHVVGQPVFGLHLHSHWCMLKLSARARDGSEVAGQLLRLALVPLGHALQRLPTGNVGRATVSALRPMRPEPEVRRLIGWAVRMPVADRGLHAR